MKSVVFVFSAMLLFLVTGASAATETVLWPFNPSQGDPSFPYYNELTADASGTFYGASSEGGINGSGAVFELVPKGDGSFRQSVLFSFAKLNNNQLIGGLVLDASGNIYGVSHSGGAHDTGYVYKLTRHPGKALTETILHSFAPCCNASIDGQSPSAGMAIDKQGNLFGTTTNGGAGNFGTIYELSPNGRGGWSEAILSNFDYYHNGGYPESKLTMDADGNLYGTASQGGIFSLICPVGCGSVFELTRSNARWVFTALHKFDGIDGGNPRYAGVTVDKAGNLYGTTEGGGQSQTGVGTVWELSYSASRKTYTAEVLHSFAYGDDGTGPLQGVSLSADGSLLGATPFGGNGAGPWGGGSGVIYELTNVKGTHQWDETILYNFTGGSDGGVPSGGVVVDGKGNIFGLTEAGGVYGWGTVFEVIR